MIYTQLGRTSFKISRICFGALTIGPLHACMEIRQGAEVVKEAIRQGINFIDTAEMYGTYPYIKEALKGCDKDMVISSRSYAYTAEDMAKSLEKARKELDRDRIEVFGLHEQESGLTIKGHWPAVEYLLEAKAKGKVGAVGISTHAVGAVRAAAGINEIEVIHPMLNMQGIGIIDGTRDEMLDAVKTAAQEGKGIYGMKAIGGGNLIHSAKEALDWAFDLDFVHSFAIGMKSPAEVRVNVAWLLGQEPDEKDLQLIQKEKRTLQIADWCIGCGNCVKVCSQGALSLKDQKSVVDQGKCVLCGYCSRVCRDFCIKVV